MFCVQCGTKAIHEGKYCTKCGYEIAQYQTEQQVDDRININTVMVEEVPVKSVPVHVKETFLQATEKVNAMVGEQGSIDVNLRDVFSAVFQKHEKEEGEILFISGTGLTTPIESEISTSWPKPWLFSRIFVMLSLAYVFLYVSTFVFQNSNAVPGLIIVGSFAVPFSLLIFFWEMNAPRNISIYETAKMFFVGGTASLVFTLFLFSVFPVYDLDYSGAIAVGVLEEAGKLAIIIYFIKKLNPKFILNGLLIGATIGAGFAAFETAGYAYNYLVEVSEDAMISVIFLRGWMAIGTHIVWSAIAGAALVYVKGENTLVNNHLMNPKFLQLFAVPVILHAVWDMPLYFLAQYYALYIGLIFIAWIFIFAFINAGLRQIGRLNAQ